MTENHEYSASVVWTGNRGAGTSHYRAYDRTWRMAATGKPAIDCSNDPLLGGDPALYNPEDLPLSSLSACHMLWYLHLARAAGVVVAHYEDAPVAIGEVAADGAGRFLRATLRPVIHVPGGTDIARADAIHGEIHRYCFIARSVAFPVDHDARYVEIAQGCQN